MKTGPFISSLFASAFVMMLASCGPAPEQKKTPNSEINSATKVNIDKSREAMGVGEGNQDERGEYPANQANLHPDSTRKDSLRRRN